MISGEDKENYTPAVRIRGWDEAEARGPGPEEGLPRRNIIFIS